MSIKEFIPKYNHIYGRLSHQILGCMRLLMICTRFRVYKLIKIGFLVIILGSLLTVAYSLLTVACLWFAHDLAVDKTHFKIHQKIGGKQG